MSQGVTREEIFSLTAGEWAQRARLALPVLARVVVRAQPDPRALIREALSLDQRSGWVLAAYAEHGHADHLASALEINRTLGRTLMAEARRIGRPAMANAYRKAGA